MSYIYPTVMGGKTKYKIYFVYEINKIYLGSYHSMEIAKKDLAEKYHYHILKSETHTYLIWQRNHT